MNKILVFTNAERWNQLRAEFDVDDTLWNAHYNTIDKNIVLKYGIEKGQAVLQEIPDFAILDEGIYLVYDQIEETKLKLLLNNCANDSLFVLLHNRGAKRNSFSEGNMVLKGNHDTEDAHYYYPLFNLLTSISAGDTVANKTNHIIKSIFMPLKEAALELLNECLVPKRNLDESNAYGILYQKEELKKELDEFRKKYDASSSLNDYKADLERLRDLVLGCQ